MTRVATFENYVEGQGGPQITDALSGITFRNPTGGTAFTIEYSTTQFGGGNYLNSNGYSPGNNPSWGVDFGFTADLPAPANRVSFDMTHINGYLSGVVVKGYNAAGAVVAQQQGPLTGPDPFTFQITSAQYDIARFTVSAVGISTGYDNVSYTVLPEPVGVGGVLAGVVLGGRGRRKRNAWRCGWGAGWGRGPQAGRLERFSSQCTTCAEPSPRPSPGVPGEGERRETRLASEPAKRGVVR